MDNFIDGITWPGLDYESHLKSNPSFQSSWTTRGIPHRAEIGLVLANSQRIQAYTYGGVVSWHAQRREVEIVETAGEALLGMARLLGSQISIDARVGGEVLIEPA